ncbi:hypothetical protein B0I35DRAFT_447899 [Stachybotrys elegans]|uniref:C3H1-type domain-containing protein n=1 Tax=Stachybotrys elegans TaxID=80388 RepID=A0A8K0T2M1_9HYPO|nr:hypothetical protein B0I35DRAFT_447899 [Stachybotrys elegans]
MPNFRHGRSGSLNIHAVHANTAVAAAMGAPRFDGPRSPPNTAHVPCKFFRQGACQAGNSCPFSHDLGAAAENICKYFAKGNCKFGPKCANVHILPDGRRINYSKNGVTIGAAPILAGRPGQSPASPTSAFNHPSSSALTNSLYRADMPYLPLDEPQPRQRPPHHRYPYSNSNYGSPRDDETSRLGLALSPVNGKGLSVLDAPLPSSFDSNGISNAARYPAAPWPSSVPSKFGLESPSPSLRSVKDSRTSDTLKLLHTSAFGSSEHLVAPTASSPPSSHHTNGTDEYFGKRAMHSSRYAKPRMLSSSMPKTSVDRDWEASFAFGDDSGDNLPENYVPENLQDLLTPAEKARRGSMRADGETPVESLSKYGSPMGSSPSRWGPLFQRHKEDEEAARAARNAGSAFGHVGSPLRNSILAQEMGTNGTRPHASRTGSESMSVLSQQLQRSRLDDTLGVPSPLLHPTTARIPNGSMAPIGKDRVMERHVSSGSISSSVTGRFTTPIDEEEQAFVFSMEEEDDSNTIKARKRGSAGLALSPFAYAGKTSNGSGSKEAVSVNGQS